MFLLAFAGAIPALVAMAWVSRLDGKRPEPRGTLRAAAVVGGLSTIPVIVAQLALEQFNPGGAGGALYTAFVVAAFTEELAKAVAMYFVVWRHPAFDERLDGIVYGTRVGLGFALVENIGYLFGAESLGGFMGIFVVRAIIAVPGHAIYAGFMGYWAARKRFDGEGPGLWGGLIIAVALHGTYDAALFLAAVLGEQGGTGVLLVLPLALVPFIVVFAGYRRLRSHATEALRLDDLAHAPAEWRRLPRGLGFVLR